MTARQRRPLAAGGALALSLAILSGCTTKPAASPPAPRDPGVLAAGRFQLVASDSCAEMLGQLRSAAKAYVGPWGLGGDMRALGAVPEAARADNASSAKGEPAPNYSGTNTHEAGVDEPDLVKTDGRRIVAVAHGVLRVVDPATRRVTGELDLAPGAEDPGRWSEADLLLHGDRALVLVRQGWGGIGADAGPRGTVPGQVRPAPTEPIEITGPRLMLVDLAGAPRLLSEYRIDGGLVDARQVGSTARIVVRSAPRLIFPYAEKATDKERLATNRAIIDRAGADAWLPRYSVTTGDRTRTGQVGCERVSRPAIYSGTSMVTVLSFGLDASALDDGDPVTIVADGDTVYSNGPRLYVANDQRWRATPQRGGAAAPDPSEQVTEIYQFDTSGPERPRYLAAGSVPGWLINQYAMSEWDGHLRVATTTGRTWGTNPRSSSAVYVLRADGTALTETGRVGGLGKGEQIYSVRFAGATGYVVTFRQTDPLYTVDLTDPRAPKVSGALKITGYSAYLHPIDGGRLLGVGQEASAQGRTQGTQVSLFDVSDLDRPTRLAQYHVKRGQSEAEFDPHAFLYWPADRLLVLPIIAYPAAPVGDAQFPTMGAVALRVGDNGFTEVGMVEHPGQRDNPKGGSPIRRSLVVDGVLWTVSDAGLLASDMSTMGRLAWLPN